MEQEKIGRFISTLRKEKNLTQMQLAEKLNITNRAVSKWERGKSMPDSSIMLELCKILDINVNELLIGEKIEEKDLPNTSEINLVKALTVVEKNKKNRKRICIVLSSLILIAIISFIVYLIYWNAEFVLDYNNTLIECTIEENNLVYKDYRNTSQNIGTINDEQNNIVYIFFQSKDFLINYIKLYDTFYEKLGYASKNNEDRFTRIIIDLNKDLNLENKTLKVYYTKTHISSGKDYSIEELPKLLKNSTLLLEYN